MFENLSNCHQSQEFALVHQSIWSKCNINHISPNKPRGLCINHHQTNLLKKCTVFMFQNSIVTWCVSMNQLMGDAYFSAKGEEISWDILSPTIIT
jgi:hypothetical protein